MDAVAQLLSPEVAMDETLSVDQRREVVEAKRRARSIRRAASVAAFNGWVTAVLAALSAPFALFGWSGALVAAGLAVVAWNELQGRKGLLHFKPGAASRLGWNQLGLLVLITFYCVWQTLVGVAMPSPIATELAANPELRQFIDSPEELDRLFKLAVVGFYGLVVLLSILFQGGNAWYYFAKRGAIERYVRDTPGWLVDVQRLSDAG